MSQPKFVFSMAWIAALVMATPATGQLVEFPVLGLPSSDGDPFTTFTLQLAHGLNLDSGQNGGRGAYVIRSMQRVSLSVASGYLTDEIGEFTFGGQAAFHLAGNADSWARIVVYKGMPRGLVWDGVQMFAIEAPGDSVVPASSPIIYRLVDTFIEPGSMRCGSGSLSGNGAAMYGKLIGELGEAMAQGPGQQRTPRW